MSNEMQILAKEQLLNLLKRFGSEVAKNTLKEASSKNELNTSGIICNFNELSETYLDEIVKEKKLVEIWL